MAEAAAPAAMSVGSELTRAGRELARAGCDTPRLDSELLLAEVLGVDRARLVIDARRQLTPAQANAFRTLLGRRVAREPVAYILGRRDFRRLTLSVDRRVLIPRPETELLVEVGLELPAGARVADVGTGSGAVALALADERPDLRVSGFDLSSAAVEVAVENARRLGLDVTFAQADLLDEQPHDAVLANLPYVATRAELAPEIAIYEPPKALFAGADGLEVVRRLIDRLAAHEPRPALVALELGPEQVDAVGTLLSEAGWPELQRRCDLAGHERVVVGRL